MSNKELTILFTFVDDFFQALFRSHLGKKLSHFWENKRGPKKKLTLSPYDKIFIVNIAKINYKHTSIPK